VLLWKTSLRYHGFLHLSLEAVQCGNMQWDPLSSKMPQIQSHSLRARQLLIWAYRDVAAEHHKGAAYQHRCYLVCLFHRGVRTPTHTHTHTCYLHCIQIKGITTGYHATQVLLHNQTTPSSVCHLLNIYTKIRKVHSDISVLLAVQIVWLMYIYMGYTCSLKGAGYAVDKGAAGKSWDNWEW